MKLRILSLLLCVLTGICAHLHSAVLTPEAALQRAIGQASRGADYKLVSTFTHGDTEPAIYEFTNGRNNIYVSAMDERLPLLGWTDHPVTNPSATPPALTAWLDAMCGALPLASVESSQRQAIVPLLATEWNQTNPYNTYCPVIDGQHAPVGCVATAMAMIVHHNHVFSGSGTANIFNADGSAWSVNLADTHFDFAAMPLTSSSPGSWHEVAMLSAICGATTNMKYNLSGSGTYLTDAANALRSNFGYDPTATFYLQRRSYSIEEWNDILYNELSHNRPVLYAGGSTAPHSFVVDGYQPGPYFHINWGWGGMGNGYFSLTSLIPPIGGTGASSSNNYTAAQECVLCRVPGAESALMFLKVSGYCGLASGSTDRIKVMFNVVGPSGDYAVDAGYIIETLGGERVSEGSLGAVECRSGASSSAGVIVSSAEVTAGLPSGSYMLYPAYRHESTGLLTKAAEPKGDYALQLDIAPDGSCEVVEIASAPRLCVEEVKTHGAIYKTTSPDVSFRVVNTGRKDAYSSMTVAIIDPSTGEKLRTRQVDNIELSPAATSVFRTTVSNYKIGSGYLTPGKYILAVCAADADTVLATSAEMLTVLDAADPSVVSSSYNPTITIERLNQEPEVIKVPYAWNHNVNLTVESAQSATLGVGFFAPGSYTPVVKFTIPYQRWEKCTRTPKTIDLGEINPAPGIYEVAYMAGGLEVSARSTVCVPLSVDGLYYKLDESNRTASLVAASEALNGHVEVPETISWQGNKYTVVAIEAEAFNNCTTLVSVGLPASIKCVEGNIFSGCEPSAVRFRSAQPPFALWQSVFGGLYSIPTSYVPSANYAAYSTLLGPNEHYSAIESLEPYAYAAVSRADYGLKPMQLRVNITPSGGNYHQAIMAIVENEDIASLSPLTYDEEGATANLTFHSPSACTITLSHPQPGLEPQTISVEPQAYVTSINATTLSDLTVRCLDDGMIEIEGAEPHRQVRVVDMQGCVLAHDNTDAGGSLRLALPQIHSMVIVTVGGKAYKLRVHLAR